jgi:hypothetical protein
MKYMGYFLLLFGLSSSSIWGQVAPKHEALAAVRTASPEVKLGTFKPLPTMHSGVRTVKVGNFKPFPAMHPGTRRANRDVKLGAFKALPTVHSGIRTVKYEVKTGTFESFPATSPRFVLWQVSKSQTTEKMQTLIGKTDAFPSPAFVILR